MNPRRWIITVAVLLGIAAAGTFLYRRWHSRDALSVRADMLSLMPEDSTAVVFFDLAQFRASPFLTQLFDWAPHPSLDEDYAQFVQATGFNYERDLDRLAIAISRQAPRSTKFIMAEGRFDRQKIEAYAQHSGARVSRGAYTVYSLSLKSSGGPSFFTFLRDDRLAWTDDPSYVALFQQSHAAAASGEWGEHFSRLAGTPLFAVVRQDSGMLLPLAQQTPGGFKSPQLAALLGQLQWITVGGKPEGNLLRVVVEGECASENTMRQLGDFVSGILVLAQAGLNTPTGGKPIDPQVRAAYLELLRSADVQKIDRGTSKSVRLVFDVSPKVLQTAKTAAIPADGAPTR